ncbi:MAG: ATP-binding cassette domain-containing protein [Defluviitaleaceae bacterium]|nr:ATP-binding cassette domain-containing protein [Defluviitaleaceae bacterium]MCL2239684.1 ATP-binding cassette domain-containing protein [Defluviitaleaceae bacterium]
MELTLRNICKSFGKKEVLKNISFTVKSGEAMGYLGRNGAGKTTTIRILADIFRSDAGEVLLDGTPMARNKFRLGYLPEERGLYPKSKVGEQMMYIGRLRGMDAASAKKNAMALLEELEAEEYWSRKLETLSKGNQQKIQLAIAVLHDPDIVILDEPFSGLDPVNASMLKRLIVKQVEMNKLVLFSSHQMPYVEEFCEHICIINYGEIVLDGKIRDIKKTYPRNKIAVWPEGDPAAFLRSLTLQGAWPSMVSEACVKNDALEILLKDASDKQALLQMLAAASPGVDRVQVVEPTLEDIFVEKASPQGAAMEGPQ